MHVIYGGRAQAGPPSLLSPVARCSGCMRAREGGPAMSVYVGIDVHRKRSQVAVIDQDGEVLANRNVPNGTETILGVIGGLPSGTPAAFEAAFGWGWLVELLRITASIRTWCTRCSARRSPRRG